jgi:acyl-CoA synthetase (AMP-forming)/AMP-acid ligase II/aryl carrier-like protein
MLGQILKTLPLKQIPIPPLSYFFEDLDQVIHIPFTRTWEEAKDSTFCVLHTSGSTGTPKPVFVTYGTFACNDAHQLIPQLGGKPTLAHFLKGKRYFLALPLFHAACLTFAIGYNIFAGVICVVPPPEPLTVDMMDQVYKYANLDGALLAPSLIVDCFNNPEYYQNMLSSIKFLSYVGGALPEEIGNEVSKRIKLMTLLGSCETALYPMEINEDPSDWSYLTISETLGHSFVEHLQGYHELVIKRDPNRELLQGVFSTFPEKQMFNSNDLFEQHPTRPASWAFRARTDDIIAFTTAEKLNPITMESTISTHPKVKSALIGGQGKFQAALLIEPYIYPESAEQENQLIKDIWPSVLQANRACPAHGRIMKQFVILAKPEKPIPRTGKGTVQRQPALQLYKTEFAELYDKVQPTIKQSAVPLVVPQIPAEKTSPSAVQSSSEDDLDMRLQKALAKILPEFVDDVISKTVSRLMIINDEALKKILPEFMGDVIKRTVGQTLIAFENIAKPGTQSGIDHASIELPTDLSNGPPNGLANHFSNGLSEKTASLQNGSGHLSENVRAIIYDELAENLDMAEISDDDNLFDAGLDSLQVQSLVSVLNGYLAKSNTGAEFDVKDIYEKPTVREIVAVIAG